MKTVMVLLLLFSLLSGCGRDAAAYDDNRPAVDPEITAGEERVMAEAAEASIETALSAEPVLLTRLNEPADTDFVRIRDYLPEASVELKYATRNNFTGQVIYEFEDAFLRYGTVMKLKAVSEELAGQGLGIKIWDGFRPVSAQFKLWEVCPDPTYVANPNKGYSNHSRGYAVDLTLVDREGKELEMPTGFDDFSAMADRDYSDCPGEQAENARFLETVMEKHGFKGYWGEWWHFNDTQQYEVETCFDPACIIRRTLKADTPLLKEFWQSESAVLTIPSGEAVTVLGYDEEYALIEYWGYRGYVPQDRLQ